MSDEQFILVVGDWVMIQAGGTHLECVEYIVINENYPYDTRYVGRLQAFRAEQVLEVRSADGQRWRKP